MCLIAWNWQPASATPLLLLANRDEFYARPAAPLHWWEGDQILAGQDLQAGGTWLGVGRNGRLAALTNYRTPGGARAGTPSRGELVAGFLQSSLSAADYLAQLQARAADYNPFNLLVYDGQQLLGLESRGSQVVTLPTGLGAVSNADFHTPWPKLVALQNGLQRQITTGHTDTPSLQALLQDHTLAPDTSLPRTGVPLELERALSAAFIATPNYGTRAASVVRLGAQEVEFTEQRFDAQGLTDATTLTFKRM
jgi:uncharacterized protein with NRDE domain